MRKVKCPQEESQNESFKQQIEQSIQKLKQSGEMSAEIIKEASSSFFKFSNPAKFRQNYNSQRFSLLFFGVAGNGKSTLSTEANKLIAARQDIPWEKKWRNQAKYGADGVTTEVTDKQIGLYRTFDSPGFDDANQELSDKKNMNKIVQKINFGQISEEGISAYVMLSMVQPNGRIEDTQIQLLINFLQTLTYSYPEFDVKNAPKFFIVFSNFTLIEEENGSDESHSDQDDQDQGAPEFSDRVTKFKEKLFKGLALQQQNLSENKAKEIIEKILPEENFFAFMWQKGFGKERKKSELKEIERLLDKVEHHGSWIMSNKEESQIQQIFSNFETSQTLISILESSLLAFQKELSKSVKDFRNKTNQRSQKLDKCLEAIDSIVEEFQLLKDQKLISFQKIPENSFLSLSQLYKSLEKNIKKVLNEEIEDFRKREEEKTKKAQQNGSQQVAENYQRLMIEMMKEQAEAKRQEMQMKAEIKREEFQIRREERKADRDIKESEAKRRAKIEGKKLEIEQNNYEINKIFKQEMAQREKEKMNKHEDREHQKMIIDQEVKLKEIANKTNARNELQELEIRQIEQEREHKEQLQKEKERHQRLRMEELEMRAEERLQKQRLEFELRDKKREEAERTARLEKKMREYDNKWFFSKWGTERPKDY